MNENLDLTKILDGCPEGTKFYNSNYGDVCFNRICTDEEYPILFTILEKEFNMKSCTKEGFLISGYKGGECTLFPSKDQRDWSKFVRFWDKPKIEKFNPHTLQPYDKVLARDSYNDYWVCTLFSHIRSNAPYPVYCTGNPFSVCIPYNEETKHLVGIDEDCPEYYKWWEK